MIVLKQEVTYHDDAAAVFHSFAAPEDAVLLESADIESKKNTKCLAVLNAAARVSCMGHTVTVTALTPTGQAILADLREKLPNYCTQADMRGTGMRGTGVQSAQFEFPQEAIADERARLQAPSNAEVLRVLQRAANYQGEQLPLLAGGFAFDYLETFEALPAVSMGANSYPDYEFVVAETVLVIDHLQQTAFVEGVGTEQAALESRLSELAADIATFQPAPERDTVLSEEVLEVHTDLSDSEFRDHVRHLQGSIYEGDIYQVVPARTFSVDCPSAYDAYRQLRKTNPSPYMFYVRGHGYELFGASPESNLKFDAQTREVQLYPIAGTRPRGLYEDGSVNHELDIRMELDMRTDDKEIAEHTMLVDLARNDLARVAEPRSRRVADLLQVDRYSRVMHLVSRVVATLHSDFDALDAYRACMNMGTLTGAPKLRAMELLRGVEQKRRGSYGGAIGYLSGDGSMDTCIVIRSAFVQNNTAIVQAGAGVVRDSNPQSEADETVHKAYAVLHAIGLAAQKKVQIIR